MLVPQFFSLICQNVSLCVCVGGGGPQNNNMQYQFLFLYKVLSSKCSIGAAGSSEVSVVVEGFSQSGLHDFH